GQAFRRIAAEFPGALRELEVTPSHVLLTKVKLVREELDRARGMPAPTRPQRLWVEVVLDFHRMLREALALKRWIATHPAEGAISGGTVQRAALGLAGLPACSGLFGVLDREPIERYRPPPRGRVLPLVWAALEARHGLPTAALTNAVFGPKS